jgi:hypothetical protein
VKFCPQLNPLDPFHPLKVQAGNFVQPAVERSFGWLVHWGGLLRDRAGRLDVSTGRLAFVAILSGVQALLNPQPIRAA